METVLAETKPDKTKASDQKTRPNLLTCGRHGDSRLINNQLHQIDTENIDV